jgi:hypothetical protein
MLSLHLILEEPSFPDLGEHPERIIHVTTPLSIAGLAGGMGSGKPSVALRIDLDDGRSVLAETSLALLVTAVRGLVARFGDPTADT